MMTTKLKSFFIFLTMMVGAVNGVWAQTADETYDFATWGSYTGATMNMTGSYPKIKSGKVVVGQYASSITTASNGTIPLNNRFAFRYMSNTNGWYLSTTGLSKGSYGDRQPEFVICNLLKGDKAKVYFSGSISIVDGDTVSISSGQELTADENGEVFLISKANNTLITRVDIYYSSTQVYSFMGEVDENGIKPAGTFSDEIVADGVHILDFINAFYQNEHFGCDFHHPVTNRFASNDQGWVVNNTGLVNNSPEKDYYNLFIRNLRAGEEVKIYLSSNATIKNTNTNPAQETTGQTHIFHKYYDGSLNLQIPKGVSITSIEITVNKNSDSPIMRFNKLVDIYDLVNLGYTEPELMISPTNAIGSINYSSDDITIAKTDPDDHDYSHDLMIINTGIVTINATANHNGLEYRASYDLTVTASEANWAIRDGNECYFPGDNNPASTENTGKLLVRRVTSVPYMNMEFGDASNSNLTMVTFRNGVRAANQIDENGWLHVWMNYTTTNGWLMTPYQGTFYKFQPAINGNLTIKGVRHHNGSNANSIVLVDASATTTTDWGNDVSNGIRTKRTIDNNGVYYSYPIVKTLNFATVDTYVATEEAVQLIGGHTYYLYANTEKTNDSNSDWQAFYLSGFKFETPDFKFPYQNVVMGTTGVTASNVYHREPLANSYQQTVSSGNIVYSRVCKGGISCDINTSTGQLSNISGSGAIVVTASIMDGQAVLATTSYVLTVPYTTIANGGTKSWIFNWENYDYNDGNPTGINMMEQVESLKVNAPASEWSVVYKVRRYDTGTDALNYINVPVLANALDVRGDNARYISSTAGLLFNANAKTFGTTTSVKDTEYKTEILGDGIGRVYKKVNTEWVELTNSADIDLALKTLLNYNASDAVDPCNFLTMENGTSMTIPNLKAGQYVRIKWSRYAENQGDQMIVNNVKDLNGTDITLPISIGAGGNVNRNGGTGYHEFIVAADGDVTFTLNQKGWANIYEIHVSNNFTATDLKLDNGISLIRKKEEGVLFSNTYTTDWADVLCQSNTEVSYAIKAGTPTGTLTGNCYVDTDNKTLKVNSGGHGRFVLIQNGYVKSSDNTTSYLLDRNEIEIKVYEYDYSVKDYPYTWNLENMSAATATALKNDSSLTNNPSVYQYKTWKSKDANRYQLTLEPENLISWSTKASIDGSQTAIRELDGLGIHPADITKSNVIILGSDNTGVEFPSKNYTEIITVPNVATGQNAYIRVKKGDNPSVEAKAISKGITSDKTPTLVYDDGTYAAYKVEGGGKVSDGNINTIEFYLKNVTVMQVAVSTDTKHISAAGYATEARGYNLDFSLNQTLTGNGVTAYKVTGVNSNGQVVKSETPYVPTYVDVTNKVATDGWGSSWCSTDYAPAVVTSDGQSTQMREKFVGNADGVNETGDILSQTVTGLENGNYSVELYANAMTTADRDNFESDLVDGAMDVAYVFANNSEVPIVARRATSTTENGVYALEAEVTNGTLTLGLRKNKAGTNWHTIQIKRLTKGQMQGVLLQGSQGDHPLFTWDVNRTSSEMADNKLIGAITQPANNVWQKEIINGTTYYNYMLAASGFVETTKENGNVIVDENNVVNGIGFYLVYQQGALINGAPYAGGKPKANSAYLQLDSYQAQHQEIGGSTPVRAYFFIDKEDEATGIQSTIATPVKKDAWYTLQGVRIDNPAKGLYIRNGKKVFVK